MTSSIPDSLNFSTTGDSRVRPSQHKSCSHLLPVDVESSDKDLDEYVTGTKHKYWCSSDVPLHRDCQPSPQVPVYFYGQYPTSAQHGCRPVSPPSQHIHSQVAQPTAGYAPTVGVQQSSHTQTQAVLGTYSPMASHQCSVVQGSVPVSYPQSKVVTGGEAGYCCVVPPPSHHSSCHPPSCTNLSAPAWSAQY
ncbi:cAMP-regulated phosphoprotein 21 isoform X1 [Lates japonicus]|uniref:cAMP-regulated phosphoprotein 21 isoform X1 n=1 Tax=Lates japonicus TaxID=270547 RepID=A0AAD3NEN9_LATJO|nr:cAMP-regulated phosphoprotein 21 isoform X1 [Lates japonicus]